MRFAPLLAALALGFAGPASAQVATTLEASVEGSMQPYGTTVTVSGLLRYSAEPCPAGPLPRVPGLLTVFHEGNAQGSVPFYLAFDRSCVNGNYTAGGTFFFEGDRRLEFGTYTFTMAYSGAEGFAPSVAPPVTATVLPQVSDASPTGQGVINAGIARHSSWHCFARSAQVVYPASLPEPPPGVQFPHGAVRYDARQCYFECGFLCPPGTPTTPQQKLVVEYPQALPANATLWQLTATGWERLPGASIADRRARAIVSGPDGGGQVQGMVAMGIPATVAALPEVQDLWWAGEAENGWGIGIGQRGGRLFVVLYVYDDQGAAQWLVMPAGRSNGAGWEGDLYRPTGTPFARYDTTRLQMGSPVGSARLSFAGAFNGTLEYTLDGITRSKPIRRQIFAPGGSATPGSHAGLWWGGPGKSGWGLHIGHQESTLFAVWYTYDEAGQPTWYVMPGGAWSGNRYSGTLYRTRSSAWAKVPYDPSRLVLTPVGSLTLTFEGAESATMQFTVDGVSGSEAIYPQPF